MGEPIVLEGAISVKAALEAGKRDVQEIWLQQGKRTKDIAYIRSLAEKKGIPVVEKKKEEILEKGTGKTSGGIAAFVGERRYDPFPPRKGYPYFLAYIEGAEDPYNWGYCMRTLYAAGCDGLFVPGRSWGQEESVILKSSAGAFDRMDVILWEAEDLGELKRRGTKIIALGRKDAADLYALDFTGDVLLALGGPMRGLSRQIEEAADRIACIPYGRPFRNALNLSCAAAVSAYEVYRQRRGIMLK